MIRVQWETAVTMQVWQPRETAKGLGMERVPPKMCGVYRRMEQLSGFSPQFTGNDCKENYGGRNSMGIPFDFCRLFFRIGICDPG